MGLLNCLVDCLFPLVCVGVFVFVTSFVVAVWFDLVWLGSFWLFWWVWVWFVCLNFLCVVRRSVLIGVCRFAWF